jgi:hypothetical protein
MKAKTFLALGLAAASVAAFAQANPRDANGMLLDARKVAEEQKKNVFVLFDASFLLARHSISAPDCHQSATKTTLTLY